MKGPEVENREKCNYSFFTNSKKYSVQNVTLDGNLKLVHGSAAPLEWDDNNQNEKLNFAVRTIQYCHRMGFQLSVPRSQSDVETILRLGKSESRFLRYYIMLGIGLFEKSCVVVGNTGPAGPSKLMASPSFARLWALVLAEHHS